MCRIVLVSTYPHLFGFESAEYCLPPGDICIALIALEIFPIPRYLSQVASPLFWDVAQTYSCSGGRAMAVLQKTNILWIINHRMESTGWLLIGCGLSLRVNSIFSVSTAAWWRVHAWWQAQNFQKQAHRCSHTSRMIPAVHFLLFFCSLSPCWEETTSRDEILNMPMPTCLLARICLDSDVP